MSFFQLLNCIAERQSGSRVSSFPMKDLGGSGRSSAYTEQPLDAPVSIIIHELINNLLLTELFMQAVSKRYILWNDRDFYGPDVARAREVARITENEVFQRV